jgi:hypothetical protein
MKGGVKKYPHHYTVSKNGKKSSITVNRSERIKGVKNTTIHKKGSRRTARR